MFWLFFTLQISILCTFSTILPDLALLERLWRFGKSKWAKKFSRITATENATFQLLRALRQSSGSIMNFSNLNVIFLSTH